MKLYANKLDNLEEMDTFLETYNLPRPNQEGKHNLKRLFIRNKAKFELQKFLAKTRWLHRFYQTYQKELIHILLELFQKKLRWMEHSQAHPRRYRLIFLINIDAKMS